MENVDKISVTKPCGKRSLWRTMYQGEDNIKIDQEIVCGPDLSY